ncbi:MAG: hypothetical protein J6T32_00940 [Paludibacteraceae bacterium]|nr:hypothetical protein [Paludibacteraceae bacterium]
MIRLFRHIALCTPMLLCLLFASCEKDRTCRQEMTAHARINLSAVTVLSDDSRMEAAPDSITIGLVGSDSLVLENAHSEQTVGVELRADTTLTKVVVIYHEEADTLTVFHTNEQRYVSLACGCMVRHIIDSVQTTHHRIDSSAILNAVVTTAKENHLQLWFHP